MNNLESNIRLLALKDQIVNDCKKCIEKDDISSFSTFHFKALLDKSSDLLYVTYNNKNEDLLIFKDQWFDFYINILLIYTYLSTWEYFTFANFDEIQKSIYAYVDFMNAFIKEKCIRKEQLHLYNLFMDAIVKHSASMYKLINLYTQQKLEFKSKNDKHHEMVKQTIHIFENLFLNQIYPILNYIKTM